MSLRDLAVSVGFSGTAALRGLRDVDRAADKAKEELVDLGKQAAAVGASLSDMGKSASFGQKALETFSRKVDQAKWRLRGLGDEAKRVSSQIRTDFRSAMEDAMPRNAFDASRTIGATVTAGGAAGIVTIGMSSGASISYESAFAGVRKTVDATEREYAQLSRQIRNLTKDIPIVHEEIAAVAEAAGQLGISKSGLLGFTETMLHLGVATNLTSEQAATSLARFANITQMAEKDFDRLGSTIVDLGNNLATTESEIVAMGLRIAGAGAQIGLSEADILGFAAALSSVGIEAEAGGSAFSKVMIDIASEISTNGKKLGQYAKVAGMSVSEFKAAFQEDAGSAIISFIEGLGRMSAAGENVFGVLEDLKLSEIRVRDALLRASGAGNLFRRSIKLGADAWEENVALTNEAEERYKTAESQLTIFKNRIRDAAITIGDVYLPYIVQGSQVLGGFIDKLQDAPSWLIKLGAFALIGATGLMLIVGPLLLLVGLLPSIAAGFSMIGTISLGILGPIALAILGIVAASILLYKNWDKVKEYGIGLWTTFKEQLQPFAPYAKNVFNAIREIAKTGFTVIKGIIEVGSLGIRMGFFAAWDFAKNIVVTATETIGTVLGGLLRALSGVVDFVAGVFTGDWERAWQGVTDVFGGIFDSIKGIAKGAINGVIDIINAGITGIGKIKAPDWVPGIGGKSLDIPKIPKLAKGTDFFAGGLALVGERGPELVHLPRGSRVTPHDESMSMLRSVYSGGDTFAPVIQITIEGSAETAKAAIPDIKREVEKALYPTLERYFARLRMKRPSLTET